MKRTATTKRQTRRVMPKMRRRTVGAKPRTQLTVGDLIAAAYDTLGNTDDAVRVLSSVRMSRSVGRRIVFV